MAELDKGFASYHRDLKRRYGLKDNHIAEGHMRGSDPSWTGARPEDVPHTPGMTRVVLVQDGATLTGAVKPEWIHEMFAEWEHQLAARPEGEDKRGFTRQVISQYLALNRHREEDQGDLVLCGAVWLATTHPQGGEDLLALAKRGDAEIRYDIVNEDDTRTRRFKLSAVDLQGE